MTVSLDIDNIAAHYGSISIVTFVAGGDALARLGIGFDGAMVAVAAAMEAPSILTALWLIFRNPLPGADPAALRDGERLSGALAARGLAHRRQECLSACSNGCAVVFRGAGRWTYVQGRLDPDLHLDDLISMYCAWAATPDGIVPWRERPEVIRKNTIARIPPMEA